MKWKAGDETIERGYCFSYDNLSCIYLSNCHENWITYGYDVAGSKLSVAYKSGGSKTKTEYVGNKVYKNGTLSMIVTEEGYATLSGSTPTYYYYLKDHQGNNRVVINQGGTVQQVNHYYPFGGLFGEGLQTANQPYKYNGKELDRFQNLDLYDYGARHYDAAIGRWETVDPLAESRISMSLYNYSQNNPILRVDPNGMVDDEYLFNKDGKYIDKIKKPGEHTGLIMGNENQKALSFKFADPVNDPKSIENGEIIGVKVVSNEAISVVMESSGVNTKENQINKIKFIMNESDASNLAGEGEMDYAITSTPKIDGVKQPISSNLFYITQTKSGAIAHNNYNFCNFLWGAGANKLGFPLSVAKMGAHYNNLRKTGYKRLDSKDDQYSIGLGYEWNE